jgi:outer membrane lipoprotein-sorting protein
MALRRSLALGFCAALASTVIAQQTAVERLLAAERAKTTLTVSATVRTAVISQDREVAARARTYQAGPKFRAEYLSGASAGRVVIDDGQRLYQIDTRLKTVLRSDAFHEPTRENLLLKNYTARFAGTAEVAGRKCDIVVVSSSRPGTPSRKVWIDKATALILRNEQYDHTGTLSSVTVYESLDLTPKLDPSLFRPPSGWKVTEVTTGAHKHYSRQEMAKLVGFEVAVPSYVPAGFVLDGYHLGECRGGVPYEHTRYVDGLNSFSIIQRLDVCPKCGAGASGRGRGRGAGRGRQCDLPMTPSDTRSVVLVGDVRMMVMGDLPKAELDRIAASLRK